MNKPIWITVVALPALSVPARYLGGQEGEAHWWTAVPGFWAFYGLAAAFILVGVARALGRWLLERKEDYYDEP